MSAENIKIIEVDKNTNKFYLAETGILSKKILNLRNLDFFDINNEEIKKN